VRHRVTAVVDHRTAIVEVVVAGSWDRHLWLKAHDSVRRSLSAHPSGLLLDLTHLADRSAGSAPLWLSAGAQAGRLQPAVPVAVCLPPGSPLAARLERLERLDRPGVRRRLTLHADCAQARDALGARRPLTDQIHLRLTCGPEAAAEVRELVRTACAEWDLEAVLPGARLVASELVGNAVEHAGTAIDVVVTRLGPLRRGVLRGPSRMRVAVYDGDPRLPRLLAPDLTAGDERGYGLRIVDAAARLWGALPTPVGKVVWAVLYDDVPPHPGPKW
jgi:hypothetical protein